MYRTALLLLVIFVALSVPTRADTLYLKNGSTFEGKLIEETARTVKFRMTAGIQTFKKSDVLRIEKSESVFDVFDKRRAALKSSDAQGLFELGVWCKENHLRKEARTCFKDAIKADPNHAEAQAALGYVKYEGKWIKRSVRDRLLEKIAKEEAEIFEGLGLGDLYKDDDARFQVKAPKGFEKEAEKGEYVSFKGPVLGKVALLVRLGRHDGTGDFKDLASQVLLQLKKVHEDVHKSADPADAKLGSVAAKLLSFAYTEDGLEKETRILIAPFPDMVLRLSLTCRDGYYDRLRPWFEKIAATASVLMKAPDVVSKEGGFGFCIPKGNYEKSDSFNILIGDQDLLKQPEGTATVMASRGQFFTSFSIIPGKKGDSLVDSTSLESLRDSVPKLFPQGPQGQAFVQLKGTSSTTTVAGEDALTGKFGFPDPLGGGLYAIFFHGDRYYIAVFLNFGNIMGETYVQEDFRYFLSSFRFM